jgi:cytochrome c556
VKRLLDGESPSGAAKEDVPLSDVADRAALMAKLNTKYEAVKSNVNTAERLKEEKDKVINDLSIMNLMMTVMADPSYDQADDPRYAGYVQAMLADQKAALEAANSENFDAYSAAIGKINNTCNECHMIFRTGSN